MEINFLFQARNDDLKKKLIPSLFKPKTEETNEDSKEKKDDGLETETVTIGKKRKRKNKKKNTNSGEPGPKAKKAKDDADSAAQNSMSKKNSGEPGSEVKKAKVDADSSAKNSVTEKNSSEPGLEASKAMVDADGAGQNSMTKKKKKKKKKGKDKPAQSNVIQVQKIVKAYEKNSNKPQSNASKTAPEKKSVLSNFSEERLKAFGLNPSKMRRKERGQRYKNMKN